jgi:hypothetical protein
MWQFSWGIFWAVLAALALGHIWEFLNAAASGFGHGAITLDDINKRLIEIRDRLDRLVGTGK